jgi:hypothetical protein
MNTVTAQRSPASGGLSTRQECTALAQAIAIRARLKLAQAYASLHESWSAEDQIVHDIVRDAAKGSQTGAAATMRLRDLAGQASRSGAGSYKG